MQEATDYHLAGLALVLPDIEHLANDIRTTRGNTYFLGTGKSGHMAHHCADLLKSIGMKSFYLEATDLLHGNIGCITAGDVVVLLSKSGNTTELLQVVPHLKKRAVRLWGVVCAAASEFHKVCDEMLVLPFKRELSGEINTIPSLSCQVQLLGINILTGILKTDIALDRYRSNHPAGTIGQDLLKFKDRFIQSAFPCLDLDVDQHELSMTDVFLEMTRYKMGCCFFKGGGKFIGLLTDGDIRRFLLANPKRDSLTEKDFNQNYYSITRAELEHPLNRKYQFIPVLDDGILAGIIFERF